MKKERLEENDTDDYIPAVPSSTVKDVEGVDYVWKRKKGSYVREELSVETYNYITHYSPFIRIIRFCAILAITAIIAFFIYYMTTSIYLPILIGVTGIFTAIIIFNVKARSLY